MPLNTWTDLRPGKFCGSARLNDKGPSRLSRTWPTVRISQAFRASRRADRLTPYETLGIVGCNTASDNNPYVKRNRVAIKRVTDCSDYPQSVSRFGRLSLCGTSGATAGARRAAPGA